MIYYYHDTMLCCFISYFILFTFNLILFNFALYYFILFHLISYYFISLYFISYYLDNIGTRVALLGERDRPLCQVREESSGGSTRELAQSTR